MKSSKIIFITLLSLIALYIIAAFIDVRLSGQKWSEFNNKLKVTKSSLAPFSVLYLMNNQKITISASDSTYLEVLVLEETAFPEINYTCADDTLHIEGFQNSRGIVFLNLHVANNLKTIKLVNSDIVISRCNSKSIILDLENSKVNFAINKTGISDLNDLNIRAKNKSSVYVSSENIDSLVLDLQNSEANLPVRLKTLRGVLSGKSKLIVIPPEEISIKRDATSKITFLN